MVKYEVTSTGPKGYQVTVIGPDSKATLLGDFCTEGAAEAFAERMRRIDADPSHASVRSGAV